MGPDANEAVVAERWRNDGLRYAREHAGEVPKVVAARVGRTWSIYGVREQVDLNSFLRGSPRWLEWLTVASFAAAVALAVAGAALVWRRRRSALDPARTRSRRDHHQRDRLRHPAVSAGR